MKALICLGALLLAMPVFSESLTFSSKISLTHEAAEFGGLSGISVRDNGLSFFAVSDKGTIWKGELERNGMLLTGVTNLTFKPIKTSAGMNVEALNIDAEEIDVDTQGRLYISFESNSRVSKFETWDGNAELIQRPAEFLEFGYNSGPEAMTIGPRNSILVAPERSGDLKLDFPIYTYETGKWSSERSIPRKPPYLIVGMDFDAISNRLYVLERDFKFPAFSSRIRSFLLEENALSDEQTLLQTEHGDYGNLEGISVWQDSDGKSHLTLIADDNFSVFYSTEIVEFDINAQ